ncbi:Uncharacterised protein [Vibrio cholerae]|nr:Uncharacterised protein [Vibrio cholerae]
MSSTDSDPLGFTLNIPINIWAKLDKRPRLNKICALSVIAHKKVPEWRLLM